MARTDAEGLLNASGATAKLAELYRGVIENVQHSTISSILKNTQYSGNPESGSVVAKRYLNSASQAYGTARTASAGDAIQRAEITINIDQDQEIVEEIAKKDLTLDGVTDVITRRQKNHINSMRRELEEAFFTEAYQEGTYFSPSASDVEDQVEETIVELESLDNDYVQGVDRNMMGIVMSLDSYSDLRDAIDDKYNANINTAAGEVGAFHGVRVFKSFYLPSNVDWMVMAEGAVAQPVMSDQYQIDRIPLSNDFAIELFYSYGTKAVAEDMIIYTGTEYTA